MSVITYRQDFPMLNKPASNLVYLDSAATSLKPEIVRDAIIEFYNTYTAPVSRSYYENSLRATEMVSNVRDSVASFLNAERNEIIFTQNCTDAINLVANSLPFKDNEEIILCKLNHHSCLLPFLSHPKVKFVNIDKNGVIDLEHLQQIVNDKTKLIAITYVSNVLGNIQPVQEVIQIAKKFGAFTLIDAAQAAGHFPINVKELDCDFLALSAHKMLGPSGVGVLYGRKKVLDFLKPYREGGGMINIFNMQQKVLKEGPARFEAGTPNIEGIIGFGAVLKYYNKCGFDNFVKSAF